MFEECVIRGARFVPARFCAPLAGYTHSAFRRLVAELGGCGAFWTEMLSARYILREDFAASPWLRRRPEEGQVVFQLMARAGDPLDRILGRLAENGVTAIDLNLACDALSIRVQESGSALWDNLAALRSVVEQARQSWNGLLTVKIRLGGRRPDWEAGFAERLRFLEEAGVDAVILHPRFFEDKFGRRAKLELIPWAASLTKLPLIANGDLISAAQVESLAEQLRPARAIMIGRMAVACPWVFAAWSQPVAVDYRDIWNRMCNHICEDFIPAIALRRIKMFAKYYASNFLFGHQFHTELCRSETLAEVRDYAESFFARGPAILQQPVIWGLR
jgi:tRNA-dihydrouridine synthase B